MERIKKCKGWNGWNFTRNCKGWKVVDAIGETKKVKMESKNGLKNCIHETDESTEKSGWKQSKEKIEHLKTEIQSQMGASRLQGFMWLSRMM